MNPKAEEYFPQAVLTYPTAEEQPPEAVLRYPTAKDLHPEAVFLYPEAEDKHPEAVLQTPKALEQAPLATCVTAPLLLCKSRASVPLAFPVWSKVVPGVVDATPALELISPVPKFANV